MRYLMKRRARPGESRASGRGAVIFGSGEQRPQHARVVVGERNRRHVGPASGLGAAALLTKMEGMRMRNLAGYALRPAHFRIASNTGVRRRAFDVISYSTRGGTS